MKSLLPLAAAFLLSAVATSAAPIGVRVQAIDEHDSYDPQDLKDLAKKYEKQAAKEDRKKAKEEQRRAKQAAKTAGKKKE
ncbi:hypothetical protein DFJ73DRAFT_772032 [Zopfochytrium polystomum]|nr:hypothetical protein DFJ73DRAFT_772032 [Zopfochytrium polystomum]